MQRDRSILVSKNQQDQKSPKISIVDPYSRKMGFYANWTGLFDAELKNKLIDNDFCIEISMITRALVIPADAEPKIPKDFVTVSLVNISDLNKVAVMRGKEIFQFIDFDKKGEDNLAPVKSYVIDTESKFVYKSEGIVDLSPQP